MELLFPLLLLALFVPMFLMSRRQKRETAKVSEMQDSLKVGDQVTTTSGLYGTVVDLDDITVDLEIAEEVVTTWLRQAIREVRTEDVAEDVAADVPETATETETETETETVTDEAVDAPVEESKDQTETRLTKD
ncbi:preprotein translocase subunit YajC [Nocardia sp. KC 131]|uniref:preprotein translocase subunit YajC n=1 Tax=Nocardia arseniciresistens TaxID=3392119 RepID=UPI00398E85E9